MTNKKIFSFSIIVAAFNEEKYITDCIKALQLQDHPGEFVIIVADNGSMDNTAKIAEDLGVQVIREPKRWVSHALIAASNVAKGEIFAYTDADTRPLADWLSKLNEAFNLHEAVVGAGGPPYYYDGPKWANFLMDKFFSPVYLKFFLKRVKGLAGFNMSIRRDVYHKSGGFEPGFNWGQDWKMAKRAGQFGEITYDPTIYVNTSFRRFHGNHRHPLLKNGRIIKEIIVASARMIPMAVFNKNLKAQKPIR